MLPSIPRGRAHPLGLPDGAGTKRQADTALAELVTEVGNDQVAKHQPGTLADLLRQWLETVAAERSAYTMEEFRRMTATNIEPAIGAVRLEKLTDARLDGFYRDLIKRGLSPASVKRNHALVHAALGRAVKWGMIPSNPADRATPPQALTRSTVSAPAVGDVQRLLAVTETESPIVAAVVALAAVTGARRGELCALRWSDVDWSRLTLTIARSLTVIDGAATAGDTKTHQKRTLARDDALLALLAQRRADQEDYAATLVSPSWPARSSCPRRPTAPAPTLLTR